MEPNLYYIESIENAGHSPTMRTVFIGKSTHGACIEVHGDNEQTTERTMIIINALNNHERKRISRDNAE